MSGVYSHFCIFVSKSPHDWRNLKIVIRKKVSLTSESDTLKERNSQKRDVVITQRAIFKVFYTLELLECVAPENGETFELCLGGNASRVLHLPRDALKLSTLQALCMCVSTACEIDFDGENENA